MYNYIIEPNTMESVKTQSKRGQKLIGAYLKQLGGVSKNSVSECEFNTDTNRCRKVKSKSKSKVSSNQHLIEKAKSGVASSKPPYNKVIIRYDSSGNIIEQVEIPEKEKEKDIISDSLLKRMKKLKVDISEDKSVIVDYINRLITYSGKDEHILESVLNDVLEYVLAEIELSLPRLLDEEHELKELLAKEEKELTEEELDRKEELLSIQNTPLGVRTKFINMYEKYLYTKKRLNLLDKVSLLDVVFTINYGVGNASLRSMFGLSEFEEPENPVNKDGLFLDKDLSAYPIYFGTWIKQS